MRTEDQRRHPEQEQRNCGIYRFATGYHCRQIVLSRRDRLLEVICCFFLRRCGDFQAGGPKTSTSFLVTRNCAHTASVGNYGDMSGITSAAT